MSADTMFERPKKIARSFRREGKALLERLGRPGRLGRLARLCRRCRLASPVGFSQPESPRGIDEAEVDEWLRLPKRAKVEGNLERLGRYVIGFEEHRAITAPDRVVDCPNMLVFMHIPKNGGTTLRYSFAKNVSPTILVSANDDAMVENPYMCWHMGRLLPCLIGHQDASGLIYRFVDRPLVHVTMLRDPIERAISLYNYTMERRRLKLNEGRSDLGVEAFLGEPEARLMKNMQSRYITGVDDIGDDTAAGVRRAKECLKERFTFFGLVERYDASMLTFKKILGWKDIYYRKENVSEKKVTRSELPEQTIESIRAENEVDIELYAYAGQLFEERCEALGIRDEDVETFQAANRKYNRLYERRLID
jgi:hypothetical protein